MLEIGLIRGHVLSRLYGDADCFDDEVLSTIDDPSGGNRLMVYQLSTTPLESPLETADVEIRSNALSLKHSERFSAPCCFSPCWSSFLFIRVSI